MSVLSSSKLCVVCREKPLSFCYKHHAKRPSLRLSNPADAVDSRLATTLTTHSAPRLHATDGRDAKATRSRPPTSRAEANNLQEGHSRHFLQLNIANERERRDERALHVPHATVRPAHARRDRQQEAQRHRERRRATRDKNFSLTTFARVGGNGSVCVVSVSICDFLFRRQVFPP